jgi:short-subunit dehydrogenase
VLHGDERAVHRAPQVGLDQALIKHAVKGFTDTLRMEMIADRAPVSVTLVKPASIDNQRAASSAEVLHGDERAVHRAPQVGLDQALMVLVTPCAWR